MEELDETLVRVIWLKLAEQSPQDTLAAMQRFKEEQEALFNELTAEMKPSSETAMEVLLYLGVTVYQVVAWRRLPKGPVSVPRVEEFVVRRCTEKRTSTVGSFFAGKQARAMPFCDALDILASRFDLPQLALLGHAAEGLLAAYEDGDLTRAESEESFIRLLVLLDALDQVVKS